MVNAKNNNKKKVTPVSVGTVLAAHEILPAEKLSGIKRAEAEHITAQRTEAGNTFTFVGNSPSAHFFLLVLHH